MSLHLMECVRPLTDLLPSQKLALLAFADSADSETQIGWPGIEAVSEWAGVSESRAKALVADLVDRGLLRLYSRGHRGRRARYVVFPGGCCSEHQRPRDDDAAAGSSGLAEQLAERLGLDVDDVARALEAPLQGAADETQPAPEGSRAQSSVSVTGSRAQDPLPDTTSERVPRTALNAVKGSRKGAADGTRTSGPRTTTPPAPHASGAGGAGCALHKTPAANCRGCGTTQRQLTAAAAYDAKVAAAAAAGPRCPAGRRYAADDTCGCQPGDHATRAELEDLVEVAHA